MIDEPAGTQAEATAKKKAPVKAKPASPKTGAVKKASTPIRTVKTDKKTKKTKSSKKAKDKKAIAKPAPKPKVVRDSFTMPQEDYAKIASLKHACLKAGLHAKKSELLRAGLHALEAMTAAQLKQAIERLGAVKTGRPKKSDS